MKIVFLGLPTGQFSYCTVSFRSCKLSETSNFPNFSEMILQLEFVSFLSTRIGLQIGDVNIH